MKPEFEQRFLRNGVWKLFTFSILPMWESVSFTEKVDWAIGEIMEGKGHGRSQVQMEIEKGQTIFAPRVFYDYFSRSNHWIEQIEQKRMTHAAHAAKKKLQPLQRR